jgi:hypothetical protein
VGCTSEVLRKKPKNQTPWPQSVSELYRPNDRHLTTKLVTTVADRGLSRGQRDESLRPYSRFCRPRKKPPWRKILHACYCAIVVVLRFLPKSVLGPCCLCCRNIFVCTSPLFIVCTRSKEGTSRLERYAACLFLPPPTAACLPLPSHKLYAKFTTVHSTVIRHTE